MVTVYTLNAFAKTENGGNPAGVVINADGLSPDVMKRIAAIVGFSETAFIQKSETADFRVRFFTPLAEVDLCGHATVATFSLLAQKGILKPGKYTQETKAGVLPVQISKENVIFMNQKRPEFFETVSKNEISETLNTDNPDSIFMKDCPAQIVSTGLRDILIPINTLTQLLDIKPDFDRIAAVSKKYNVIGYHLFTLDTMNLSTAHCRNFAPLYDIPEEAATGTSNGALSCYLYQYGLLSESSVTKIVFEQGYSIKRPSEIFANLTIENKIISKVRVGGIAQDIKKVEIEL